MRIHNTASCILATTQLNENTVNVLVFAYVFLFFLMDSYM